MCVYCCLVCRICLQMTNVILLYIINRSDLLQKLQNISIFHITFCLCCFVRVLLTDFRWAVLEKGDVPYGAPVSLIIMRLSLGTLVMYLQFCSETLTCGNIQMWVGSNMSRTCFHRFGVSLEVTQGYTRSRTQCWWCEWLDVFFTSPSHSLTALALSPSTRS